MTRAKKAALHTAEAGKTLCGRDVEVEGVAVIVNGLPTCGVCRRILRGMPLLRGMSRTDEEDVDDAA